eukprot:1341468-Rhodomonas_salina.1
MVRMLSPGTKRLNDILVLPVFHKNGVTRVEVTSVVEDEGKLAPLSVCKLAVDVLCDLILSSGCLVRSS